MPKKPDPLWEIILRPAEGPTGFEEAEGPDAEGKPIVRKRRYERRVTLRAADKDEARYIAERQARDLVAHVTQTLTPEQRAERRAGLRDPAAQVDDEARLYKIVSVKQLPDGEIFKL